MRRFCVGRTLPSPAMRAVAIPAPHDRDHEQTLARPIIPLIMCGGAGTRLWPASREGRPKQFLPLFGPHSTFQDTIRRVSDPALFGRP